jgi:hypothetical protein
MILACARLHRRPEFADQVFERIGAAAVIVALMPARLNVRAMAVPMAPEPIIPMVI